MTKLFLTGATGYIGGDVLYAMVTTHPEYEITALVRSKRKGAKVAQRFPRIRLVYGDLDDEALIESEAQQADVVLHCADSDHESSAHAISKGLVARAPSRPGFSIHTSGTAILAIEDLQAGTFGTGLRDKIYDDLEGVQEITSLPDFAIHRNVDKIVLNTGTSYHHRVKTAIVCPPTIYGIGRGPVSQRSMQVPELCRLSLEAGKPFQVNQGLAYWNNVHIQDLSTLYVKLVEKTVAWDGEGDESLHPAIWGAEGYYFCENGEHIWGDISQLVADEGKKLGYFKTNEVESLPAEDASSRRFLGQGIWGANSRGRAKRARAVLDWQPVGAPLEDEVKHALLFEAKMLGLQT